MALIEALASWNPWWGTDRVPESLLGRARRESGKVQEDMEGPRAAVLVGIRRAGKTTTLYQAIQGLLESGVDAHRVLYVNLEDAAFDNSSLEEIVSAFRQEFSAPVPCFLFFDEVQTRQDWSRFVRVVIDQKRHRIAVTGSSSSLLSGEPGRLLTGRHATTTIRPLDFPAYLSFHGMDIPPRPWSREDADALVHRLDGFLDRGGFPQPNLEDPERARTTLNDYFLDVLERDVVAAMGLDPGRVRRFGSFLIKTLARPHTKSSLQRATEMSRDAIRTYLQAFEDAFLFQRCTRFSWSPKPETSERAPVKYYLVDPGLRVTGSGQDRGWLAENVVANAIHSVTGALHYWASKGHEVDFVVPRPGGRLDAVQVTYGMDAVPEREVRALEGLWDALPESRRGDRLILTRSQNGTVQGIRQIPLWQWLIDPLGFRPEVGP